MSSHNTTRRNLLRAGAGAMTAVAYGGTLAVGRDAIASQSDKPTTVTYWHVNTETFGGPTNEELFRQFEELTPGVTIEDRYHENSYVGLMENLQIALAAGDPPDVAQIGYLYLDYAATNFPFTPIDALVAEHGPADFLAPYSDNVLALGRVDGALVGMPFSISNPVTYFNADMLREAGLDPDVPPTTWEAWAEAGRVIRDSTGKAAITLEYYAGGNWLTQAMVESNGGRLLSCQDGTIRVAFDGTEAVEAIQRWADLIDDGASLYAPGDQGDPAFLGGETAAFIGSIASRDSFQTQASFDLRAAPFPRFGDKPARLPVGGNALFVFAQDPDRRRAAWDFVRFMESPESLTAWTKGTGYIPPRDGLADDPQYLGDFLKTNPIQAVGVAQVESVVPWVSFPGPNGLQAGKALSDAVEEVLIGERSAAEALPDAASEVDSLLGDVPCA